MHQNICFEKIKEKKNLDGNFAEININGKKAFLKPVDNSDETVKLLTEWRNKHVNSFFSNFVATEERTKKWLQHDVIENPNRILFMIIVDNKKIGHAGMCRYNPGTNSAEIDNFIRIGNSGFPGLMVEVEKIILRWIFDELGLSKIQGFLFADNNWSNLLHQKCGFIIIQKFPLKKVLNKDGWVWEEDRSNPDIDSVERFGNLIEITKQQYDSLPPGRE